MSGFRVYSAHAGWFPSISILASHLGMAPTSHLRTSVLLLNSARASVVLATCLVTVAADLDLIVFVCCWLLHSDYAPA